MRPHHTEAALHFRLCRVSAHVVVCSVVGVLAIANLHFIGVLSGLVFLGMAFGGLYSTIARDGGLVATRNELRFVGFLGYRNSVEWRRVTEVKGMCLPLGGPVVRVYTEEGLHWDIPVIMLGPPTEVAVWVRSQLDAAHT